MIWLKNMDYIYNITDSVRLKIEPNQIDLIITVWVRLKLLNWKIKETKPDKKYNN